MKKRIQLLVILLFAIFSWGCSSDKKDGENAQNSIVVSGTVKNGEGKTLYLHMMSVDTAGLGDWSFDGLSNSTVANGKFSLRCQPGNAEPMFYRIGMGGQNTITTLARRGEQLTFTFSNPDTLFRNYKVKGGQDAQLMCELDQRLSSFIDSTDHLMLWFVYSDDDTAHAIIENAYMLVKEHHRDYLKAFIAEHPHSIATIAAFYQKYQNSTFFDEVADIDILEKIYQNLSKKYPRNSNVRWVAKRLELIHKNIDNQTITENNSF